MLYIKLMKRLEISVLFPVIFLFLLTLTSKEYLFCAFLAVTIHEMGHLLASLVKKKKIERIRIMPMGMDIKYSSGVVSYKSDIFVLFCGCFFNLVFALIFAKYKLFSSISLYLAVINSLPVRMLDGGRILENFFLLHLDEDIAIRISKYISFFTLLILWILSAFILFYSEVNASLFFFTIYLFCGCFLH